MRKFLIALHLEDERCSKPAWYRHVIARDREEAAMKAAQLPGGWKVAVVH